MDSIDGNRKNARGRGAPRAHVVGQVTAVGGKNKTDARGSVGEKDHETEADQAIASTAVTSGTMALMRRSIPCLTVIEEMGQ
jgi:hypothetical protein